jgi:hypothetical protein
MIKLKKYQGENYRNYIEIDEVINAMKIKIKYEFYKETIF